MNAKPKYFKLRLLLTGCWAAACFGLTWWVKALDFNFWDWPFGFWWAAQGAVLLFVCIAALNAWYINRSEARDTASAHTQNDV